MLLIQMFVTGCVDQSDSSQVAAGDLTERIDQLRARKDEAFRNNADSPIRDEDKTAFTGLSYYPVNEKYLFQVFLEKYESPEQFSIVTSSGKLRETERYGYFDFELEGQQHRLQVYKLLDIQSHYPGYLFLPFMDATSGRETYGGGRYLDFKENAAGVYQIDFNQAYNPSCAYGKSGYNCPIPPEENRLSIAVHAGEKKYVGKL